MIAIRMNICSQRGERSTAVSKINVAAGKTGMLGSQGQPDI